MTRFRRLGLYLQALVYVAGGVNHFLHQRFYVAVMPTHYADPVTLVKWSGVAEIVGGVGLLIPATRRFSAVGIATMLVVFLDVHIFMLRNPARFPEVPAWLLWGRLPLQAVLILWALQYARPEHPGDKA